MSTQKPVNGIIRILIVDDHPVVCSGLTSMLSAQIGMEVLGLRPAERRRLQLFGAIDRT